MPSAEGPRKIFDSLFEINYARIISGFTPLDLFPSLMRPGARTGLLVWSRFKPREYPEETNLGTNSLKACGDAQSALASGGVDWSGLRHLAPPPVAPPI